MMAFLAGVGVGALVLFLVLDNNPALAKKLGAVKNVIEKEVEKRTGKDI